MRTSATVSTAAVTGPSAQGTNQTPAFTRIKASTLTWSSTAGRSGALTGVQRGVLTEVQNTGLKEDLRGATRMKMRRDTGLMGAVPRGVQRGAQEPVRPAAQSPGAPGGRGVPEAPGDRGSPEAPEVREGPGEVQDLTEAAHGRTEVPTVIQGHRSLVLGPLLTLTERAPAARTNQMTRNGGVA